MFRISALAVAAIALAGCFETTEPVFDSSNSVPVTEQAKFMEFVEFMDAVGETPADDPNASPRELIEKGALSVDLGDLVLVQSEEDGKYTYMGVAVLGSRAFTCFVVPGEEIETTAQNYGVTVVQQEGQGGPGESLRIDGDKDKVATFITDQMATAPLVCFAMSKEQRTAPQ